ncbi:hypothetical protein SUGI_0056930 [Cryptomeria japonica]|nr:hypothetical protein SUGI_0056930 [Cryptomeria japonica]
MSATPKARQPATLGFVYCLLMKTHGCPHINTCSSCLLPSAFLVALSILLSYIFLFLHSSPTVSFSTSFHKNSFKMTTSDVSSHLSVHSSASAETHQSVSEADLSLCLSLSPSANMGKGYPRVSGNESVGPVKESAEQKQLSEMGNGGWFKGRLKRVNSETIGGEEERKRRVVSLQLCEPSCEQVQGNIHSSLRTPAVGWPPLQTCRKNAVYAQQRSPPHENVEETTSGTSVECKRGSNFVKVVMDGMPIGRKVDLNAHNSYNSLALTLENMFQLPPILKDERNGRLLDSASDYLLTYVDKDGDWMLLGDAPWENFVKSVKRLRISHSTINGSSSELVGAKDYKKMNYRTRQFIDFVNAQRL